MKMRNMLLERKKKVDLYFKLGKKLDQIMFQCHEKSIFVYDVLRYLADNISKQSAGIAAWVSLITYSIM